MGGRGSGCRQALVARYDIARRTVRIGVTRFMACALLAGYVWLACAGILWTAYAALSDGPGLRRLAARGVPRVRMSMVFAHAPVIVPAVLRVQLPFRRGFYVHLGLLHASLALRLVGGDLAGSTALWQWGGIAGEVAILLFLTVTAEGVLRAHRTARRQATDRADRTRARQAAVGG